MSLAKVVVTGIGVVSPIGHTTKSILNNLRAQRHNFKRLSGYTDFKRSKISIGTEIPDFDTHSSLSEDWTCPYPTSFSKDELRSLNPHTYYAYQATREAIKEARLNTNELGEETGLFTASPGSISNIYHCMEELHEYGVNRTDPYGIVKSVVGTLSWNLSALFKIKGSNCGFTSACASSSHALGFAYDQIALGRQDRIIVTGAEDGDVLGVLPFGIMRALSTSDDPDSASLPFDSRRSGFVGCGGATTVVLESASAAAQRGVQVLAEFHGWGQSSDGYHPAAPIPEGIGLSRAIAGAIKSSGFKPDSIEYLNAHATGTQIGDLAEIRAIKCIFGESPKFPISSTKGLTGHGLSYAGILEIALCIRALSDGFTPGTANLLEPDPQSQGLHLPKDNLENGARRFLSNSSGFGGANVCLAMKLP